MEKKTKIIIAVILFVLILGLGVAYYFIEHHTKTVKPHQPHQPHQPQQLTPAQREQKHQQQIAKEAEKALKNGDPSRQGYINDKTFSFVPVIKDSKKAVTNFKSTFDKIKLPEVFYPQNYDPQDSNGKVDAYKKASNHMGQIQKFIQTLESIERHIDLKAGSVQGDDSIFGEIKPTETSIKFLIDYFNPDNFINPKKPSFGNYLEKVHHLLSSYDYSTGGSLYNVHNAKELWGSIPTGKVKKEKPPQCLMPAIQHYWLPYVCSTTDCKAICDNSKYLKQLLTDFQTLLNDIKKENPAFEPLYKNFQKHKFL